MNYRFLNMDDLPQLHRAYVESFADYAIKIQPTLEQISRVLVRNGLRWDISAGAFDGENRLIAFTANGFDQWLDQPTAYDSGTGVLPAHRRSGAAYKLFEFMLPKLKEEGIRQYLLEVISTNEPALRLYRKLGFEQTRELEILALDSPLRLAASDGQPAGLEIREIREPDWERLRTFWNCAPSWQNSASAIARSKSAKLLLGAYLEGECVGYGVVSPSSGDIPQLAVSPQHRGRGIGSALLRAMCALIPPDKTVTMNNVDSTASEMLAFCAARGFKPVITQFEMLLKL